MAKRNRPARVEKGPKKPFALRNLRPYLYLLPIVIFAVGFIYYPFVRTIINSVSLVNAKGQIIGFAGLENFRRMFKLRNFGTALKNTLRLTAMFVPLNFVLTLSCALLCNKKRKLSPVYETFFTLPMAIPMTALAMIFKVLLNPTVGFVNYFLGIQCGWFTDKATAMYGILIVCLWMGFGFDFLLFLSALRAIPDHLIEAAQLDGAGSARILFSIQIPQIAPTALYIICTNLIQSMMTSGPMMVITEGGPSRSTTSLIYLMFTSGYQSSDYSMAACISIVTFALTFGLTLVTFYLDSKKSGDT